MYSAIQAVSGTKRVKVEELFLTPTNFRLLKKVPTLHLAYYFCVVPAAKQFPFLSGGGEALLRD